MKYLKPIILALAVVAVGGGLWLWWQHESIYPSTDDAYLKANVLSIAPQVGGKVETVSVSQNQHVTKGDLLFRIDTTDLEASLKAAQAAYDTAVQQTNASITDLSSLSGRVDSARAALTDAQDAYDRTDKLFKLGDVAQAALDQATTTRDQAKAALDTAEAGLASARQRAGQAGKDNPAVRAAKAQLALAQINLSRAKVTAPVSGWVANLDLRPGALVAPNGPLFSLVEDGDWWIDANFKETDLARLRPGQPVTVNIDMYPGLTLEGTVQSLGAGSGAVFSLLPPQNASGNWVKVTQRFPVRIALDTRPDDSTMQLRVGASTRVTVDTSGLDAAK
ncbi:HlyD family secretion protein [Ponticoccus alexandrii]|uniref:HlyD family efflux transporter periplasmic adaptor subunit n=1 Tax=Ponticoccus alexandrii TaxID=1943633 RepID=A0ABX7FDI6_9RHOB|nr:HlyD family secretion protein [Ponticoccus alexandrii]QRF68643.1 HlyD family efflux transporter periplasmic adaptor subunit [Ponticoccus alexandrii]